MPIDSRDKRFSLVALALPFGRIVPEPDGAVGDTKAERAHWLYLYAMDLAEPPPPPAFDGITLDADYRALVLLAATLDGSVALDADYRVHAALSATYGGSVALTASYRTRIELEASYG